MGSVSTACLLRGVEQHMADIEQNSSSLFVRGSSRCRCSTSITWICRRRSQRVHAQHVTADVRSTCRAIGANGKLVR